MLFLFFLEAEYMIHLGVKKQSHGNELITHLCQLETRVSCLIVPLPLNGPQTITHL